MGVRHSYCGEVWRADIRAGADQAERVQRSWTDQGTNYTATYAWSALGLSGYGNNGINEPSQVSLYG